ncbi:hypothetical protein [Corynebacterium sp. A21]|uniref:hypothetical protein n=1 Tax=Corynebacterium sp. A21 TaxID=3457318 RepID=UPI003FCEEACF
MDRQNLFKLLAICLLVIGYVFIAAFDFHREAVAPVIVLAVAAVLFLPFGRWRRRGGKDGIPASELAGDPGARGVDKRD